MYIQTSKLPWESLREEVIADDTPITVFQYSNWPAANTVNLRGANLKDANEIVIAAFGGSAVDKTITSYKLYGRTRMNGAIMLLATGVMTTGTQACTVHPLTGATLTNYYWIDTITVTGGLFKDDCTIMDDDSNRISMLKFKSVMVTDLYLEIDLAASGIDHFSAIVTGY